MENMDELNESHYITKEDAEHYASKNVAGTALGFGIAGTALSLLSGGLGIFNGTKGNSGQNVNSMNEEQKFIERKQNADYIQITKDYYENKLASLRELTNSFYTLDQKISDAKAVANAENRASFDSLNKRIIDLEKSDAVLKATQPLYQVINDLKMNNMGVMTKSMIDFESERRRCADNTIVNYANSTFYPRLTADLQTAYTSSFQPIYNPLLPPSPLV